MDPISQELEKRREEIAGELDLLFKANIKVIDWDVPEADDRRAAKMLLQIMREELDKIAVEIETGKYDNY